MSGSCFCSTSSTCRPSCACADHLEILLQCEQLAQAVAENGMIVRYDESGSFGASLVPTRRRPSRGVIVVGHSFPYYGSIVESNSTKSIRNSYRRRFYLISMGIRLSEADRPGPRPQFPVSTMLLNVSAIGKETMSEELAEVEFQRFWRRLAATWAERLRIAIVPGPCWGIPVQSAGAGGAGPCAAAEDLRGAGQPGGKGIRAGGAGEDQAVFGGGAEPGDSRLPGAASAS